MKKLFLLITSALLIVSCDNSDTILNENDGPKTSADSTVTVQETKRYDIPLTAQLKEVNEQTQQFSFNFLRAYNDAAKSDENFCISPFSASICLGMVLNGAKGNTYSEIQKVLGFEGFSNEAINAYAKTLQTELPKLDNYTAFANANSIWLKNDIKVLSSFVDVNKDAYAAEVKSVPFNSETLKQINDWCSEKTNKLIPTMLDNLDENMRACLINAIYFKGPWESKFDESSTKKMSFFTADGNEKLVSTMNQTSRLRSYLGDDVTVLELPYGNEAFSMIFFMPKNSSTTSLNELMAHLDATQWNSWISKLTYGETELSLPTFKLASNQMDLVGTFQKLGILDAFNIDKADFTNLCSGSLCINKLLQKTYIDVNEKGTEAAAVTLTGLCTSVGPSGETPRIIKFSHPFGFVLRETSTGTILFAGKCGNPMK